MILSISLNSLMSNTDLTETSNTENKKIKQMKKWIVITTPLDKIDVLSIRISQV